MLHVCIDAAIIDDYNAQQLYNSCRILIRCSVSIMGVNEDFIFRGCTKLPPKHNRFLSHSSPFTSVSISKIYECNAVLSGWAVIYAPAGVCARARTCVPTFAECLFAVLIYLCKQE